jgi:hypothetical protein
MAINTDPLFSFGQNLTPEQLAQMQALKSPLTSTMNADGIPEWSGGGGSLPGKFGPSISFDPAQVIRGTGVGPDAEYMNDPSGAGTWNIYQPRNISNWGGSDVTGVWNDDGTWSGYSSGMTDLRGLGIIAASAVGGAYMNGGFGDPSSSMGALDLAAIDAGAGATNVGTQLGTTAAELGAEVGTVSFGLDAAGNAISSAIPEAAAAATGTAAATTAGTTAAQTLAEKAGIKLATGLVGTALAENQTRPETVDTQDAVQKQAQANIDAMNATNTANRVNTTTPYGSQTFRQIADPSVPGGIRWEQDIKFSPEQQQLYDAQTQGQIGRTQIGNEMLGGIRDTLSQPLNLSSMDPDRLQRGATSNLKADFGGPVVDPLGQMQLMDLGASPDMDRMAAGQGPQARDLYGQTGYSASVDQVRQSVIDQFENQNGQAFARQAADLDNKLKNMGLTEGTEAYDREMDNLRQTQGQQRNDAIQRGIQAGGAEQSRLAGIDLTADNQRFQQQQTTDFLNPLATIQANNQASNQEYQNLLAAYNQQNQAKDAAQKNAIGVADSANAAENMRLNFGLNQTGLNNQTLRADQQTALQLAQHNDQNAILERSVPLNNYTALMTGTQATLPQFQPFGMGSAGAAPVMQGAQLQQQQNNADANRTAGYWQQGLNLFGNWLGS